MREGEDEQSDDVVESGGDDDAVGGEEAPDARQSGGADQRAHAERAVEDAVAERSLMEVVAGHDGEQRPDGGEEEGKGKGAESADAIRRVADVAQAGADGGGDAFGREART